jgi:hypothetical protein
LWDRKYFSSEREKVKGQVTDREERDEEKRVGKHEKNQAVADCKVGEDSGRWRWAASSS